MYTMDSYNVFSSYQELYRTEAIKDRDLLIKIVCMLPYFLTIDGDNSTLDHLLYDQRTIDFFEEQKALLCPLCGYALNQDDFSKDSFNCKHCNTLFNPIDETSNSTITSYLYNTMKETDCQEKNQNFQEKSQKKSIVSNKDLQSNELETQKISHPKYLQKNKRTNKENHYFYDSSIVEHLTKAHKGAYVCPICNSGLRENKSGALSFDSKGNYFHCFACDCVLSPIDKVTSETVALQLREVTDVSKQELKEAFQDNIESFYNQLQQEDLELSNQEKQAFIEHTFSNRGYSSDVIDYCINCKDIFVANDNQYPEYKRLYVSVYDTNLQDLIGFQKLSYYDKKLNKYFVSGSSKGFTLFSNPNHPNCCFIVESVTNALAVFQCGFNALCCYTKGEEQPYKAYAFALQNGLQPILFLDRDVTKIDSKYISINWIVNIEPFFSPLQLKSNADASDLLVLDRGFLTDLLKNAYNTYYKKLCYSDISLEDAFKSKAKLNIIQAPIGIGKTTEALKIVKNACYPLFSVYTKELTEEIGSKVALNVVNSDNPIVNDTNIGIVTTHARLGKTTELQDYAVYSDEKPFDVAIIDETHKFIKEESTTIVQPYICEASDEEENTDYRKAFNNEELTSKCKEGANIECISYKREENKQAISPIKMANEVNASDVKKYQNVILNREYSVKELTTPENFPIEIQGTSNIRAMKIDAKNAFWLAKYTLDDSIDTMLSYEYDEIKKELKETFKKVFCNIRNLSLPLAMLFYRNIYVVCAFPIRKKDKKVLSFEEWKEDIRKGVEMENANNDAIYFKVYLRYVNLQPLLQILKKSKQVFLIGASDFVYKESFIKEFERCYGNDFKYYNLAPINAKKELETNVLKLKKLKDEQILQIMKLSTSIDVYKCFVFATYDRADDFYKKQQRIGINNYARATKEGCKSLFSEDIELQTIDNKVVNNAFYNLIIHGNAPILESSNKLAQYTLMFLDCNQYKPKIAYANPYLQDLGMNIIEQLKVKLIQQIGRLYRQQGNRIVLVLMNYHAIEFDLVTVLKEKSEEVKIFEDSTNYSYYKDPKCFVENIQKCLAGKEMTKYKIKSHKAQSSEQKEKRKAEKQEQKQAKIIEKIASGASERELKQNIKDYKEKSKQEKLQTNKEIIRSFKPLSASPFDDKILNSEFVFYDTEVFPNAFVINFHSDKGKSYEITNPSNDWMGHFLQLPLIGFNNANYDNPILYYAYIRSLPQCQYRFFHDKSNETLDFNSDLKAFSDRIINDKNKDKELKRLKNIAKAIGIGDSQEMIVKNVAGHSFDSIKCFMLDFGLSLIETPYAFDTVLTDEQLEEVKKYCRNDSYTVFLLVKKYYTQFQASLKLAEEAGLNGNYSKSSLIEEVIYGKKLSYKERLQYNSLTIDCLLKEFPNFKVLAGVKAPDCYVLEFDDMIYYLGDGGFNLLPKNAFYKDEKGNKKPIKNNHGLHYNVLCLDVSSMHPHSLVALNYFGIYTKNYLVYQEMKDICSLLKEKGFNWVKEQLAKYGRTVNTQEEVETLRNCLKLLLNSTYGLTHMKDGESPLKKCSHNLIALRGALFIATLHHVLINKFKSISIIQIKTDSIKIENYTEEIKAFCEDFARQYGYEFEIEDIFSSICCNGNDYVAVNFKGELIQSSSDEEDQEYTTATKGSSFQLIYDENGILRAKDNLRSLLFTLKGKSIHKLGIKKTIGKKEVIEYAQDVKSTKVKYYLAVKKEYGYYPYYETCRGVKSSVKDLKNQTVIPIYDLKELEKIDKSIIDYSFYQTIFNKFFDSVLSLLIEKKVDGATMNSIDKQTYEKRLKMKYNLLDEKEKKFFDVVKTQLAFV